jgi:hypothetical protein
VIGIVLVVVSAIITQRSRYRTEQEENQDSGVEIQGSESLDSKAQSVEAGNTPSNDKDVAEPSRPAETDVVPKADSSPTKVASGESSPEAVTSEAASYGVEEEIVPLKPLLAATPISSPNALTSATYSAVAPPTVGDSPYAYGNTEETKTKPEATLLRWSGKTGSIQIGELIIRGPVTYWSDGPSNTPEPSCIDVTLPVEYPDEEHALPNEGAGSYQEMTPLQRGGYLLWLAGGRIQPPPHVSYPILWLFGLERRVLSDRLDISICIGEAFRLIPLIRWESLRQTLIKFITWMAAKVWLPEEQLVAFSRSLPTVPAEILDMLLRPYADAKLPLPSAVAFTIMRASPLADGEDLKRSLPHSEDLVAQFAIKYKSKCQGGLILSKPKSSLFVAYVPTNPTLSGDKNASGGVLELPDFFKDLSDFVPLVAAWRNFLKDMPGAPDEPLDAAKELEDRPDWESFIRRLRGLSETAVPSEEETAHPPLVTNLRAVADLMRIENSEEGDDPKKRKPGAANRKIISEAARVEGLLVLPDLGIAGKEYHWDDILVLAPFPLGARPSLDYNAAALLLEYACALLEISSLDALEDFNKMRKRLEDYFSLSSDEQARLEELANVFLAASAKAEPGNLGECLQFWLQQEERATIRDFLVLFLMSEWKEERKEEQKKELVRGICGSLDVQEGPPPAPRSAEERLELGLQIGKILSPLFKD